MDWLCTISKLLNLQNTVDVRRSMFTHSLPLNVDYVDVREFGIAPLEGKPPKFQIFTFSFTTDQLIRGCTFEQEKIEIHFCIM